METYHKIQTLFKRHLEGPKKGKMIRDAWTTPELEYLSKSQWQFTEKLDGTNIRIGINRNTGVINFQGRTDNAQIPEPLLDYLDSQFNTEQLRDLDLSEAILFGEGLGPKIQGSGKYSESGKDYKFVLFDVKIGDWWLRRADVNDIANKLGVEHAPVIGHGTLYDAIDIVSTGITWNDKGQIKNWGYSGGGSNSGRFNGLKSQWGNFEAEGIVARPVVDLFDRQGKRIITKIKAVDFR